MKYENIVKAVSRAAAEYGADGYEIRIVTEESAGAEALGEEINSVTYTRSGTMTVRCIREGKSGYASSERIEEDSAAELVRTASENALIIDDADEVGLFEGSEAYEKADEEPEELWDTEKLKEHTIQLQKQLLAQSDKIVDGSQSFTSGTRMENALYNSLGLALEYAESLIYHGAEAAVKDGEDSASDYRIKIVSKEDIAETARKAAADALAKLGADTVESGKYQIILDPAAMRSLLSTYSTIFSARSAYMKTTLLRGREGEKVASELVTILDDPFYPGKTGRCPFDGEGVAARKNVVIERGVLRTLLYNRMYAKLLGRETTGNAAGAKEISPKGLYLAPGELTEEQLLARLGDGLYITDLNGLHAGANTASGDFSLQAEGFVVEGGKKVRPVKNFTVADNFYEFLKKVDAISDQVEFGVGSNFGAPAVLFTDISISGK